MDMRTDPSPHAKPGPLMKLFIKITGVDSEVLENCPGDDWDNVRALGEIMILTWVYQAALFTLVGHELFAAPGHFRLDIVLVAMFLATFILCIDSYMFFRSGWHLNGIEELMRGGLDVSGGPNARIKAGAFLAIRIALSIGLAQLLAVLLSLLVFAADISAVIQDAYLKTNAHLIAPAAALVDDGIKRATDAVSVQTERVNALSAQISVLREHEVDPGSADPRVKEAEAEVARLTAEKAKAEDALAKAQTFADNEFGGIKGAPGNSGIAGYGLRYRAAMQEVTSAQARAQQADADLAAARARLDALRQPGSAASEIQQANGQLAAFQKDLEAENEKLADLKKQLAALIAGRENAIRRAVESAPDHVGYDNGFLARIRALGLIAREDGKIAAVILLIDIVSFGFELAAVLAKVTSYVPTAYATSRAREAFLRVVRIVDEIMGELKSIDGWDHKWPDILPPDGTAGDGHDVKVVPEAEPPKDSNTQPPKRGRGRPRKHPLPGNGITGPNGQQGSSTPPKDPQEPESEE
jgi:Domain of unknown function (DUF4407)